jgi:DNA-binding NarL/FixJ family response regulator
MEKIKIIIVDDHPVVIDGLRFLLQDVDYIEVAACFTTGEPVVAYLQQNDIAVVLLDITLPDVSGIELCGRIKKLIKKIKVLGLSNHNEHSIIAQMLKNGANGYLLKNASAAEVLDAINKVLNGGAYLSAEVQKIMLQSYNEGSSIPVITRREKEILELIADGKTTNEIASTLFISTSTVETHRKNLMQKLEVSNVASLIKKAVSMKLI